MADAIERASNLDRVAIRDAMAATDMTTVIGPVDWGIELGGLWAENAPKYGYEVVVREEYAPSTEDLSDMIFKARGAGRDSSGLAQSSRWHRIGQTDE